MQNSFYTYIWAWAHFLQTIKWFHLFLYYMNTLLCKNSSISNNSLEQFYVLNIKTVLSQTSTQFKCQTVLWAIERTLSDATTPGYSGPGSDGNEGVLLIPQSSSISEASPSDCLVSYPGHSLREEVLPLYREAVGAFYSPSWLGHFKWNKAGLISLFAFFYNGCLTKTKETNQPNDLLIPGSRADGFIPITRALVWRKMQTQTRSDIWVTQ